MPAASSATPSVVGPGAQAQPRQTGSASSARPQAQPAAQAAPTPASLGIPQAKQGVTAPGMPGANDPSYLAYMRQMGVEEANLNILLGHRVGAFTRELGRGLPAYATMRERAITDQGNSWEDRGMFRSGGRQKAQADAALDVDRERADWEAGIRDQIAESYITTAMEVAELRRGLLEQGLSAAQANAIANAEAGLI